MLFTTVLALTEEVILTRAVLLPVDLMGTGDNLDRLSVSSSISFLTSSAVLFADSFDGVFNTLFKTIRIFDTNHFVENKNQCMIDLYVICVFNLAAVPSTEDRRFMLLKEGEAKASTSSENCKPVEFFSLLLFAMFSFS